MEQRKRKLPHAALPTVITACKMTGPTRPQPDLAARILHAPKPNRAAKRTPTPFSTHFHLRARTALFIPPRRHVIREAGAPLKPMRLMLKTLQVSQRSATRIMKGVVVICHRMCPTFSQTMCTQDVGARTRTRNKKPAMLPGIPQCALMIAIPRSRTVTGVDAPCTAKITFAPDKDPPKNQQRTGTACAHRSANKGNVRTAGMLDMSAVTSPSLRVRQVPFGPKAAVLMARQEVGEIGTGVTK